MFTEVTAGGFVPHTNDILIKTGWSTESPRAPWDTDPEDINELPSATESEESPAPTGQLSEKEHMAPEEPEWTAWSSDPFALIIMPFGALLEPEGYTAMRAMKQRRTDSYAARMPRTYAVAQAIYNAVVVREVWGEHLRPKKGIAKKDEHGRSLLDVTWLTHTAGKWVGKKGDRRQESDREANISRDQDAERGKKQSNGFPEPRLKLLDVIKTLADPDSHAVGNKDVWDWRFRHRMVRNIRFDIDLDKVFERHDLAALQGEMKIVHGAFRAFGLNVGVMRTGNRGIQAIASIPPVPRAHAELLVHALRHVLQGAPRGWQAKDFQSNVDGIMRLPLGRHAWTGSMSCMLAPDASVLPLECQAEVVSSALNGPTKIGNVWAEELDACLASRRIPPWANVPVQLLTDFIKRYPNSVLVRLLDDACAEVGATPMVGSAPRQESLDHSKSSLLVSDTQAKDSHVAEEPASSTRIPVNKARAWAVLNAGFAPGASFAYYMNLTIDGVKGRNAIGMALVAHDGDAEAARAWLHRQAREVGCPTEAVVKDRLGLIDRCLKLDEDGNPRNNTYTTLQQFLARLQATKSYRALDGDVLPEEADLADRVVGLLVERQRGSEVKRRAFTDKALEVVRQAVGLLLTEMRLAEDAIARVSYRSLASRMTGEAAAVKATEVARQMAWIVSGPTCLVECFRVVPELSRSAFDPSAYVLGEGLTSFLPNYVKEEE